MAHAVAAVADVAVVADDTTAGSWAAAASNKQSSRAGGVGVGAASAVVVSRGTGVHGCACCQKSDVTRARSLPRRLPWSLAPADQPNTRICIPRQRR